MTFVLTTALLGNTAYGFPRGALRRISPKVLCVIHVTGNPSLPSAQNERDYANRTGSDGPSAHYYVDRDGHAVKAIEPLTYAAWSNGDEKSANLNNAGVRYLLGLRNIGRNPNEGCHLEIECVGHPTQAPVTDAQLDTVAQLAAVGAKALDLPIDRSTMLTHADINSVDRSSCAFLPADRERRMAELIARTRAVRPAPTPVPAEDPMLVRKFEAWHAGKEGATRFDAPDGTKLGVIPAGTELSSCGETLDGKWRLVATSGSGGSLPQWQYIRRAELEPFVQGGDPAFNKACNDLVLSRKAPTPTGDVKHTVELLRDGVPVYGPTTW